ncbi:MAG: tyrosine-type recombinase/integrase [Candidatus Acidiferrum sp.]
MTAPMPIVANVVEMRKPRKRQVRARLSYLDNDQIEKFLRAAKEYGPREYSMFLTALAHGMRASETAGLRLTDLNFKNGQIHVARLKGSLDSVQGFLQIKGNSLFDEARALRAWLAVRERDAQDFVYNSQKSCRLHRVTIFRLFQQIARAAGLPETLQHPHVLKHSAAMLMVKAGMSAFHVKQHLGHKSFDSTLQYVAVSDSDASASFASACAVAF